MNRFYNVIWSAARSAFVVVSEKTRTSRSKSRRARGAAFILLLLPLSALAATLPQGGTITTGQGSISSNGANQLIIKQNSDKLGVNWQSFNVGADGHVIFDQPGKNSIALNRVIGSDGSSILGKIDANGQVFLINPNGVIFGKDAQVNVGGLVASTMNISDDDFRNGNLKFQSNGQGGEVINHGTLQSAEGGYVALLGRTVANNGVIRAKLGTAALAAGDAVTLDLSGDGLITLQVAEGALKAQVSNHGLISADGGHVLLTARATNALLDTVVNNDGVIEARTIGNDAGRIFLDGGMDGGAVRVAGTLDASAPGIGDGGFIETSGANVTVADGAEVTTKSNHGKTGSWLIDPTDFIIADGSGPLTTSGIGATTLSDSLANTNVELQTSSAGDADGDINVNADVTWDEDTTLTLTAHGTINVNADITTSGDNGGLTLNYSTTTYNIADGHHINLNGSNTTYTENGDQVIILRTVDDLLKLNDSSNEWERFALAGDIDASITSTWNGGLGYDPAVMDGTFYGHLNGLGHSISDLYINRPNQDNVGLIGKMESSKVSNLTVSGDVTGKQNVGMIVGSSVGGTLTNLSASGAVTGNDNTGGVAGQVDAGKMIRIASAVNVQGRTNVGGVVGSAANQSLQYLSATGDVSGTSTVGGAVGLQNSGSLISSSAADGDVTGQNAVGGLVGSSNSSSIDDSSASGTVSSSGDRVGGLVGAIYDGEISGSFSSSSVTGHNDVGGLVGNANTIDLIGSHATGSVTGTENVGGLAGYANNVHLSDSTTSGIVNGGSNTGGVVGQAFTGSIENVTSDAKVTGTGEHVGGIVGSSQSVTKLADLQFAGSVTGRSYTGGVIGYSSADGTISNLSTTDEAVVVGESRTGGVIGSVQTVTAISDLSGSGSVSGTDSVGGAIGYMATGFVKAQNIKSDATVNGSNEVGGLIGNLYVSTLDSAYSTGNVTGTGSSVGGLIGTSRQSTVTNTLSTSNVHGGQNTGGLIGNSSYDQISTSFSTGDAEGNQNVGGFIGNAQQSIVTNTYATGQVTADGGNLGGFVGSTNYSQFRQSYATGHVNSPSAGNRGGFAGAVNGDLFTSTFWDTDTSGIGTSAGTAVGKTSSQMKQAATFSGWGVSADGKTDTTWRIYEGNTSPLLTFLMGSASVHLEDITTTYTGLAYSPELAPGSFTLSNTQVNSFFADLLDLSESTVKGGSFGNSVINAGTYYSQSPLYSGQFGLNLVQENVAKLTINKAVLDFTVVASDKTYDATTGVSVAVSANGLADDVLTITGYDAAFADKNAGIGKEVNVTGISIEGSAASNYTWGDASTTADVAKANLNVTATADNKQYDGTTNATVSTSDSRLGADDITVTGSGAFADKNAGTDKTVTVGVEVTGADAGNYYWSDTSSTTASIDKAHLVVTANAEDKVYDALTTAQVTLGDGRIIGDNLTLSYEAAEFEDKNAGSAKGVTVSGITLSGDDALNYTVDSTSTTTANIEKAALNVSANAGDRIYDGSTDAIVVLGDDRFTGDDLYVTNTSANFSDKNAGSGKTVTVDGISVTGADADNYTWSGAVTTTANIDKANLNIVGVASDKRYDGGTSATVTFNDSRVAGDDLVVTSGNSSFSDKNVGNGKTVTTTGISVSGEDAQNYSWSDATTSTADIAKANLVVVADSGSKVAGAQDGALGWKVEGGQLYGDETLTGELSRAPGEAPGTYAITQGSLTAGGNYDLTVIPGTLDVIAAPKPAEPVHEEVQQVVSTVTQSATQSSKTVASTAREMTSLGDYRLLNLGMKLPDDVSQDYSW